jgi:hypothetical protein
MGSGGHVVCAHAGSRSGPPPLGFSNGGLPLVERLRFKDLDAGIQPILELVEQTSSLDELDDEFWSALDSLDRRALVDDTLRVLDDEGRALTIAELAERLPPSDDLETLALWLTLALEAELPLDGREDIDLDTDSGRIRFSVPLVEIDAAALADIDLDL